MGAVIRLAMLFVQFAMFIDTLNKSGVDLEDAKEKWNGIIEKVQSMFA